MVQYSKTEISFITLLGAMVIGQIGYILYQGNDKDLLSMQEASMAIAQSGSAKAFGLVDSGGKYFQASSVKELDRVFETCNYTLASAKSEGKVPRLYLSKLPKDMKKKPKASNKTFVQVLLPHILKVNEEILADRQRLLGMQARLKAGGHLRHGEKIWLQKLASDYRCKSTKIETLLTHVDIVPPSLALAQATLESGGGRSHAALNKNSTFGHMRTRKEVMSFPTLEHNVRAYVTNLNRHAAYKSFRTKRASLRKGEKKLCGVFLAAGLLKYSERGQAYIRDIQGLIKSRNLAQYDHVSLDHALRLKP